MIHLDPFTLSGNKKCGHADAVVMFIVEGGAEDDNDTMSDRTLNLKGHVEPIRVTEGKMDLQFCYGYNCNDYNYLASAFSLERLGNGTMECKPPSSLNSTSTGSKITGNST